MKIILGTKAQMGIKVLLAIAFLAVAGFFVFNALSAYAYTVTYSGSDARIWVSYINESITFTLNDTYYALANKNIVWIDKIGKNTAGYLNVSTANYTFILYPNGTSAVKFKSTSTLASGTWNVSYTYLGAVNLFTITLPENNTVFYNRTANNGVSTVLSMTTNTSFAYCGYGNGNGTYFRLVNVSTTNQSWANTTSNYIWDDVTTGNWQNIYFTCHDTTNTSATVPLTGYAQGNYSFTNSSIFRFKVYAASVIPFWGETGYANNAWYKAAPIVNMSTTSAATNCSIIINGTVLVHLTNSTTMNASTVYWTNNSEMSNEIQLDTAVGGTGYNITYMCADTFNTRTWTNASASVPYSTIYLDNVIPRVWLENYTTDRNYTSGGQYINITFNTTDVSALDCNIRGLYQEGLSPSMYTWSTNKKSTTADATRQTWFINITPADVIYSGKYILQPYCTDAAGNANISSTNKTVVLTRLYTGWNPVSIPYNYTLAQIAGLAPNISYVSIFSNFAGFKNYTTYTAGSSTNALLEVNQTNGTYIYVTQNTVLMMNFSDLGQGWMNMTLWGNTSTASGWNYIALPNSTAGINSTIWNTRCNTTAGAGAAGVNCDNITLASVYVPSLGKWCSAFRTSLSTSCYPTYTSLNLSVIYGQGMWLWTNSNLTYNRTIG